MALLKEDVVKQIRDAFADVKRPPDDKILHFPGTGGELWIESFLGSTEKDWNDINPENIGYECSALAVVSPAAFFYYLPAYMTWELRNPSSSSNTVDYTLYDLDLTDRDANTRKIMEDRFSALSETQGEAVLAFLKFMGGLYGVDNEAANSAIASYWKKFEKAKQ